MDMIFLELSVPQNLPKLSLTNEVNLEPKSSSHNDRVINTGKSSLIYKFNIEHVSLI